MPGKLRWVNNLEGASSPWQVSSEEHLNDEKLPRFFVLKGFRDGDERRRLLEFICGRIAGELRVGAPGVTLLALTAENLDFMRRWTPHASGLGTAVPGLHVGVSWVDAPQLARKGGLVPHDVASHQVGQIIGCDTLLHNKDRHSGNLLIRPHRQPPNGDETSRRVLVPIDWDLAFEGRDPSPVNLASLRWYNHVYAQLFMREAIQGSADFGLFVDILSAWSGDVSRWQELFDEIPPAWNVPGEWTRGMVEYLFRRTDQVLERFSSSNDWEGIFPNWQQPLLGW